MQIKGSERREKMNNFHFNVKLQTAINHNLLNEISKISLLKRGLETML